MNTLAAPVDDDDAVFQPVFELVPLGRDDYWKEVEDKTTPVHTAQRLKASDPAKFKILKRALEEGTPLTTLARSHQVGINTLYAIIKSDLGGLDKYHATLAGKFKAAANLGVDKVMELMPTCKDIMQAGIVTGIMADKAMAMSGAPSLVIEHRHVSDDGIRKLTDMIEAARTALATRKVEGRIIEESTPALPHSNTSALSAA